MNKKMLDFHLLKCSDVVEHHGKDNYCCKFIVIIFSIVTGASKLIVENSFISYFKESTHIYEGNESY